MRTFDTLGRELVNNGGAAGVNSLAACGYSGLQGDVILTPGCGITLSQSGQEIQITACGGGGAPGGVDTNVQYNYSSTFAGENDFSYNYTTHSLKIGQCADTACSNYSFVHGSCDNVGDLKADGSIGNQAHGYATSSGQIQTGCGASGANAYGVVNCGYIYAWGSGSESSGVACSGSIISSHDACKTWGYVDSYGYMNNFGYGSEVAGWATACGQIQNYGDGCKVFGFTCGGYLTTSCGGSLVHGDAQNSATISAYNGCHAHGVTTGCGLITANGTATHAHGYVADNGLLQASSNGSTVWGQVQGYGSHIIACGYGGNWAGGYSTDCGYVESNGGGSGAFAYVVCGGGVIASGFGTFAYGVACGFSSILSGGSGSEASGYSIDSGSSLVSNGLGSKTFGQVQCGGYIGSFGGGSEASGFSDNSGALIIACGLASKASGSATTGAGYIAAYGEACEASGFIACGTIYAYSVASYARGASIGYSITSNGYGARATGFACSGDVIACGSRATAHGDNISATGDDAHAIGRGFANSENSTFQVGFGSSRFKVTPYDLRLQAGQSSGHQVAVGGAIKDFYTDVSNTSTTETDLYTFTVPAQTLEINGDKLTAIYGGLYIASANQKTIKAYFAGTSILDTTALAITGNETWQINIFLIKTGSSTARVIARITSTSTLLTGLNQETDLTSQDFTTTNIIKITGQGGASTEVTAKLGTINYIPSA